MAKGILIKITGGFYYVETADGIYTCKARGIFRKKGSAPLVGDNVEISIAENGYNSIESVFDRKNYLVRPPLANIDTLIIVSSGVSPVPNTFIIDKMIAAAVNKGIEPVVVFSKTDLTNCDEFISIYNKSGIKAIEFSSVDRRGEQEIRSLLKNKITAFTGNSGVGKSTLLNTLFPKLQLETGDISQKLGRGRHTTRTVELFKTDDGYVGDTPGFSTVDLERYEIIKKENIQYCFPEFDKYLGECRFVSCSHTCEKDCAIINAVKSGDISKSRHDSYCAMYNEVKDIKDWELR